MKHSHKNHNHHHDEQMISSHSNHNINPANKPIILELEGLTCAHCIGKIEEKLNQMPSLASASINFASQTLTLHPADKTSAKTIISQVTDIVHHYEPDVLVHQRMENVEQSFVLVGLDCANCAQKIQDKVAALDGVSDVRVDFVTTKLTYTIGDGNQARAIYDQVETIIHRLEPDVIIKPYQAPSKPKKLFELDDATMKEVKLLIISAFLFMIALLAPLSSFLTISLYIAAYLIAGKDVLLSALRNLRNKEVFDENFLMSIATLGAFAIGEYPEGVAVMLFYLVGEIFQSMAVNQSRRNIADLMDIRPDFANLEGDSQLRVVAVTDVAVNDMIVVKPGEKIPLDGIVVSGESLLDTSALTGESVHRIAKEGDTVYGGFINQHGLLRIQVTNRFVDSKVAKILELVEHASSKKAPTEQFITKFARIYTPIVVFAAVGIAVIPTILFGQPLTQWVYRALIFLVISCPCALVVSIPLGFFGGIGAASKRGILVKGGNYLEGMNHVDTVIFDKTGTLTKGVFEVTKIHTELGIEEKSLLDYAAHVEQYSNHPIAKSILLAYSGTLDGGRVSGVEEVSGKGLQAMVDNETILVGNERWMKEHHIDVAKITELGSVVYVARNNILLGHIVISDEIKDDAHTLISQLKQSGVRKTVMLTGDSDAVGQAVAKQLGIDVVHTQLLPDQKVEFLEHYMDEVAKMGNRKKNVVFVGDGINDAPVLARSDIGIAMGGLGSDAAIEAADIVLMSDEPSRIVSAIAVAKRTSTIVWQNIMLAFVIKGLVMLLGAGGLATMWEAVFADVGVTFLAVLNSIRVLNTK